jgi:hypothetical protein
MKARDKKRDSISGLRLDLMTAKVFGRALQIGRWRRASVRPGHGDAASKTLVCYRRYQPVSIPRARRRRIV